MRPVTDDVDTSGFFHHAAEGRLAIGVCDACDALLHPPSGMCPACGAITVRWRPVAPAGHLVTWTVVERQVNDAFPTPYTIVLIELDDEPEARFVGSIPGRAQLAPGQRMAAGFPDGAVLPEWRPVGDLIPPTEATHGDGA